MISAHHQLNALHAAAGLATPHASDVHCIARLNDAHDATRFISLAALDEPRHSAHRAGGRVMNYYSLFIYLRCIELDGVITCQISSYSHSLMTRRIYRLYRSQVD
jgi:hypothetical protein